MNRKLFVLVPGFLYCLTAVANAAIYSDVYWVGGSGEWTGDVTATPEYSTGHWSASPTGPGLPAKFVLGRNDGIRVGEAVGAGGYDLDRLPCDSAAACTTTPAVTISGGTQLGTDMFISGPGVVVTYNPNRQLLSGDDALDRFGDWRIQPNVNSPGTPTLNISNGAVVEQVTAAGGDADGMWTRWNGAELNIDGGTFRRTGDETQGFASGAMMVASYHGYANSIQTITLTNGGRIENEGQLWFGISGTNAHTENQAGIRVVMTINDGHLDLTGGDEYALDNDALEMRADLAFIYDWKDPGGSPDDDETLVINFTGPGDITVDGQSASPLDTPAAGAARGGIRVATNLAASGPSNYGNDANIQRSYLDLWNMGILRANNKSGLTGDNFNTYFSTTNNPGDNNYKLTSLLPSPPASLKWRGDFNDDGKVDGADYVIWRKTLGSTTNLQADADGSLNINAADYIHWKNNFGAPPGSGSGFSGAVPEPGTMMLMLVGLFTLWTIKRR
jgi:PEP-CTERM motif